MRALTQPGPTVMQVSTAGEGGRPMLSVIAKRTYDVLSDGRLIPAAESPPLLRDPEFDAANPRRLHRDSDAYAFKPLTDVVVRGHAYGGGQRAFVATVQAGGARKELLVIGDRRVTVGVAGRLILSEPSPIERIPLRYDRAYGGIDQVAHQRAPDPLQALERYLGTAVDPVFSSPFAYPRNFAGVGYLIEATAAAVERLVMPNLEDPRDRLTADRLAVGVPGRWPLMPLPQGFDWTDPGTFPRMAYMGIVHDHDPIPAPVAEVVRGFAPADVLEPKPLAEKASPRWANGASLGLQLPLLRGGEEVAMAGVHPQHPVWRFRLPRARPDIRTDGRNGQLTATEPVIHTVDIEPDLSRVSLVWRGHAPAVRRYAAAELTRMPLYVAWP
ncbi:MAG TPA: DUF2169 domain-containing protein [Polyangia bacterium]|nr:DUF2169 domain-containing protein [Polyangia bacterium]